MYCCVKNPRNHVLVHALCFESVLHGEICARFSTQPCLIWNFQSEMHDDAKTWADAGTLKVKYPVNADNLKPFL